jgi:hypothetical protein
LSTAVFSFFDDDVLSRDETEIAQTLAESIHAGRISGGKTTILLPNPSNCGRLLRLDGKAREEGRQSARAGLATDH